MPPNVLPARRARHAVAGVLALAACARLAPAAQAAEVLELQGRGVQIYVCTVTDGRAAWRFKAPEATLLDASGQDAGTHFAGPSWRAKDGSTVVGEVVASGDGAAGAVPWLVLRAKLHAGDGVFAGMGTIVRSRTAGGVAPAGGCDDAHAGAEARVPYSAVYTFFPGS